VLGTQKSIEYVCKDLDRMSVISSACKDKKKRVAKVCIVTKSGTSFLPKRYSERNHRTAFFDRAVATERTKK
jgi:hypothetical protein